MNIATNKQGEEMMEWTISLYKDEKVLGLRHVPATMESDPDKLYCKAGKLLEKYFAKEPDHIVMALTFGDAKNDVVKCRIALTPDAVKDVSLARPDIIEAELAAYKCLAAVLAQRTRAQQTETPEALPESPTDSLVPQSILP
jgi:hypothetical protein